MEEEGNEGAEREREEGGKRGESVRAGERESFRREGGSEWMEDGERKV